MATYTPPLYISRGRGTTWATASSSYYFPGDIIGTNQTLWTVTNKNLYYSNDIGKNWYGTITFYNS